MTALATRNDIEVSSQSWAVMKEQAGMLVKSGFLPATIRTAEAAVAIMLKGRELGIPAMQAFAHIHIINGKPTISAELMLALIFRTYPKAPIDFDRIDENGCEITAARPGGKPTKFKFDRADAERAKTLLRKDVWIAYPRAMYRSRAVSEMARSLFPECLMGCSYTPEEMGAAVAENGDVIDVQAGEPIKYEDVPFGGEAQAVEPPPPAEASTKSAVGIYTGTDSQMQIVGGILKKRNMPEHLWAFVYKGLMNRPSTEINKVMAEVMSEARAKAQGA